MSVSVSVSVPWGSGFSTRVFGKCTFPCLRRVAVVVVFDCVAMSLTCNVFISVIVSLTLRV